MKKERFSRNEGEKEETPRRGRGSLNKMTFNNRSIYVSYLLRRNRPEWRDIMNSYSRVDTYNRSKLIETQKMEEKMKQLSVTETTEYEYSPLNTNIKLKRKISYLDTNEDYMVKEWIKSFNETVKLTHWDNQTSLEVAKGLARCEEIAIKYSYITLENMMLDIKQQSFYATDGQYCLKKLANFKQNEFIWIIEYVDKINEY